MKTLAGGNGTARVISINSGVPFSGKTSFATNIAVCLAGKGKKVLLFNLGVKTVSRPNARHIGDIVTRTCAFQDAIASGPCGLEAVHSWPGGEEPVRLSMREKFSLVSAFEEIIRSFEFILIDIGDGWSETGLFMNRLASETVFISAPAPESIEEAVKLMKVHGKAGGAAFKLVVNKARSKKEGLVFYALAKDLADGVPSLSYLGSIIHDENLKKAAGKGLPVTAFAPETVASINYGEIADWICIEPLGAAGSDRDLWAKRGAPDMDRGATQTTEASNPPFFSIMSGSAVCK